MGQKTFYKQTLLNAALMSRATNLTSALWLKTDIIVDASESDIMVDVKTSRPYLGNDLRGQKKVLYIPLKDYSIFKVNILGFTFDSTFT